MTWFVRSDLFPGWRWPVSWQGVVISLLYVGGVVLGLRVWGSASNGLFLAAYQAVLLTLYLAVTVRCSVPVPLPIEENPYGYLLPNTPSPQAVTPKRPSGPLGYLFHTWWTEPRKIFENGTLLFVYLLPAIYISFWVDREKHRLDEEPLLLKLEVIEGRAAFSPSRRHHLRLILADGSTYVPICRPLNHGGGCGFGPDGVKKYDGKAARAWVHPKAGALHIEIDGRAIERLDFSSLKASAMDTSGVDFMAFMVKLYAFLMLVVLPCKTMFHILTAGRRL